MVSEEVTQEQVPEESQVEPTEEQVPVEAQEEKPPAPEYATKGELEKIAEEQRRQYQAQKDREVATIKQQSDVQLQKAQAETQSLQEQLKVLMDALSQNMEPEQQQVLQKRVNVIQQRQALQRQQPTPQQYAQSQRDAYDIGELNMSLHKLHIPTDDPRLVYDNAKTFIDSAIRIVNEWEEKVKPLVQEPEKPAKEPVREAPVDTPPIEGGAIRSKGRTLHDIEAALVKETTPELLEEYNEALAKEGH